MPPSLHDHVVVITGASSGIGRLTARRFASHGARVVLAARDVHALDAAADEVSSAGGHPLVVPTDVTNHAQVQALAQAAVDRFGRIDTWVNGAGVSAYGELAALDVADIARVIDVDLMGQIHGVKAALPVMRAQGSGTIIGISSALGARTVPLQVPYCAAKKAVIALMEGLRMEERRARSGVVVTTVYPSSINTPLFDHARSVMGVRPAPIPPIYDPGVVADSIVFAAAHPRRDIFVGAPARQLDLLQRLSPALTDRVLGFAGQAFRRQQQRGEADAGQGNLHQAQHVGTGHVHGNFGRFAMRRSAYTKTFGHHPRAARLAALAAGALAVRRATAMTTRPIDAGGSR